MNILQSRYRLPPTLMAFIDDGFVELLSEDEPQKTVQFHMPSMRRTDDKGRIAAYSLTWIHPDFNKQFCHYYDEEPGDLPNFYVTKETTDSADEAVELEDVDDLIDWLGQMKSPQDA